MSAERCGTIAEALASITTLEELEAFTRALRDPDIATKTPTAEETAQMAAMKIAFQRERPR